MFWNISRIYFFFFSIQNIRSNYYIIFLILFPVIFLWWNIYSLTVLILYKRLLSFYFWSNQENLYMIHHNSDFFMTFKKQSMNLIADKLTIFQRIEIILISIFKRIKNFFYYFTCFIINHDLYLITFWMHYTLFIIMYRRNKSICYC